ncbi:hypothetical protein [Deinococcus aquaedulcis]|uniref:hypothetical protein n=1 Tax=Deinococcus aquaedulcis TaxID=2840455 RepID=UPI001C82BAFA|nr:hypothetical protein [Deinococcus aquaedulcis]
MTAPPRQGSAGLSPGRRAWAWRVWRWTLGLGVAGVLLLPLVVFTEPYAVQGVLVAAMYGARLGSVLLYGVLLVLTRRRWQWLSLPVILVLEPLPFGLLSLGGLLLGLWSVRRRLRE